MENSDNYIFKVAETKEEFEKIYKLNYATFVEEIKQHNSNSQKILVDKFHLENTYIICLKDSRLVGMLAFRSKRPFSLDYKFKQINRNVDDFLPPANNMCEVRLLSVSKKYRRTKVFTGLMKKTIEFAEKNSFDLALISGILNQQKLYKSLGFQPFGPVVGDKDASFQPMYLNLFDFKSKMIPLIYKNNN